MNNRIHLNKAAKLSKETGPPQSDLDSYCEAIKTIAEHRLLARKVRLTDHMAVHQILMRLLARMISYCRFGSATSFISG